MAAVYAMTLTVLKVGLIKLTVTGVPAVLAMVGSTVPLIVRPLP